MTAIKFTKINKDILLRPSNTSKSLKTMYEFERFPAPVITISKFGWLQSIPGVPVSEMSGQQGHTPQSYSVTQDLEI